MLSTAACFSWNFSYSLRSESPGSSGPVDIPVSGEGSTSKKSAKSTGAIFVANSFAWSRFAGNQSIRNFTSPPPRCICIASRNSRNVRSVPNTHSFRRRTSSHRWKTGTPLVSFFTNSRVNTEAERWTNPYSVDKRAQCRCTASRFAPSASTTRAAIRGAGVVVVKETTWPFPVPVPRAASRKSASSIARYVSKLASYVARVQRAVADAKSSINASSRTASCVANISEPTVLRPKRVIAPARAHPTPRERM
mmetsp:Transcript_5146/g.17160  ORF Transcript_5146/g.17160 Transcript_5146/m.17160 type:complete len:251 (-) Transcript_5146:36-788(-)